jgi:hypothetical protein
LYYSLIKWHLIKVKVIQPKEKKVITAYDIEYNGIISLSYNAKEWKLTDGLSLSCLSIENNQITHPINHNEVLNVIL